MLEHFDRDHAIERVRRKFERAHVGGADLEVLRRARAFDMRVIAYDPYVTPQLVRDLGADLCSLADLYKQSDYITVHVSLTPETDRLLNYLPARAAGVRAT